MGSFRFRFVLLFPIVISMMESATHAASSHLVVDHESGHVLISKAADEPRAIASLTKIAAVLVALEWSGAEGVALTTLLPVPPGAISGGANPLGLQAGDEVSLETAFFAAMMASDNTSTHAFAEWIGSRLDRKGAPGSGVDRFVERMNRLAVRIGMSATRFVTPHGLEDSQGNAGVSTASDVGRLSLAALDHPELLRFASGKEREVGFLRKGKTVTARLVNTNELAGSRGIDGLKTGTTRRAGPCLVVSASRDLAVGGVVRPRRLVVVLLDAEDRFREAVLLLNQGWPACEAWVATGGVPGNQCLRKEGN
jgi:D-alanyl-D-alanine carboxypeptidase (penicillin-binding protein 5/6)